MSSPKSPGAGIRSVKGHSGGIRSALRPWSPAAVGLASALATGGALAQQAQETPAPAGAEVAAEAPAQAGTGTQPGAQEGEYVLPTVQVVEEAEGYAQEESSLTRLPTALVDTPQTVTVVPKVVLEEQRATTVRDALRNISGITVVAGEGGRQGDTFSLRGFSAQNDVARDGVRDLGWFTRDTFNLNTVEAYFGPSAVLFGRGSTGGVVNLVTKKPTRRSFVDVRADAGTAPSGRVELDVNQALSEQFQVRINAAGQLAGVPGRDGATRNRGALAPSARLQLGKDTALEFDYLYQREDSTPDYGQPFVNGQPISSVADTPRTAFYGVQGSDSERVNAHVVTGRLQQELGGGVRLTNTLRYGAVDRFARPTSLRPVPNRPDLIGRQRWDQATDADYLVNQTDLRGTFSTGFLEHTASAGLELSRETREQLRHNLVDAAGVAPNRDTPTDLYAPEPGPDLSGVSRSFQSSSTTRQWTVAAYASDQVALTRWLEVLGSARFDVFDTDHTAVAANGVTTPLEARDVLFNWRAGLVAHPAEGTSVYAMYGTSANPSAELGTLSNGTASLDPERNQTFEVGGKADLLDARLSVTAAVFRVDKLNARVPDPSAVSLQVLEGRQRVQGLNAGVAGTLTREWKVFANYTFMDSEIREHTSAFLVGQPLPNTPEHSLSLWTTVDVLEGLSLGGGAVYQGPMAVNNPANETAARNTVPRFVRFDAVASYAFGPASLQLNLNNLTNALYYDQLAVSRAVPADGRSLVLSGKVRF